MLKNNCFVTQVGFRSPLKRALHLTFQEIQIKKNSPHLIKIRREGLELKPRYMTGKIRFKCSRNKAPAARHSGIVFRGISFPVCQELHLHLPE